MPKTKLSMMRPSKPRTDSSAAAKTIAEGTARIHIDVPVSVHVKLKMRTAERRTTIREYLLDLLARDGIRI